MEAIKRQVGRDRYAIFLPTNEWAQPVIFGMQAGSPLLRDGGRYGAFSDSAFRRAFEWYVGLFRDSLAPPFGTTQLSNVAQEFGRGTFAWYIGDFKSRLPAAVQDKWSTAPLPGPTGDSSGVSLAGGSSLVIFRAAPHKAASWRLVEFLSRPEQQARFYRLTGDLPARTEAWRDTSLADNKYARAFGEQLRRVVPLPKVPEAELIVTRVLDAADR